MNTVAVDWLWTPKTYAKSKLVYFILVSCYNENNSKHQWDNEWIYACSIERFFQEASFDLNHAIASFSSVISPSNRWGLPYLNNTREGTMSTPNFWARWASADSILVPVTASLTKMTPSLSKSSSMVSRSFKSFVSETNELS